MAGRFPGPSPSAEPEWGDRWRRWLADEGEWIRETYEVITPVWTGASADPAIGNGTLTGWYSKYHNWITFNVSMTAGSTTTFGTGAWSFFLPADLAKASTGEWNGSIWMLDSGTGYFSGTCEVVDGGTTTNLYPHTNANVIQSSVPFTWATSDEFHMTLRYRIGI